MRTSLPNPFLLFISAVSLFSLLASAADPDPLQDFCVAVLNATNPKVYVNGWTCKDPQTVTADDFYYSAGLHKPQEITSPIGTKVTTVYDTDFPGLHTQGLAHSRIDYAPHGLDPPHTHPRSSETILCLKGTLWAAFITTDDKLYAKILHPGDMYVFPRGLIHFQLNLGNSPAAAFVSFNSQKPGVVNIVTAMFRSKPPILDEVLQKAYGDVLNDTNYDYLQSMSWDE